MAQFCHQDDARTMETDTSHTFMHPSSTYKTKVGKMILAENISVFYMTEGWEVSCFSDRSLQCKVRVLLCRNPYQQQLGTDFTTEPGFSAGSLSSLLMRLDSY